jgi:hypothetical protein
MTSADVVVPCPIAPFKFEAFFKEAFPFQRYLEGIRCINVSLGAQGGKAAWASFTVNILRRKVSWGEEKCHSQPRSAESPYRPASLHRLELCPSYVAWRAGITTPLQLT